MSKSIPVRVLGALAAAVPVFAVLAAAVPVPAAAAGDTTFDVYGYVKGDVIYDFKRVAPAWNSTLRPSQIFIPRAGEPLYENGEIVFSVKSSRLGVNIHRPTEGLPVDAKFEIDFYGTGSNAGQLLPRVRHAHLVYGNFLVGQAWSLFTDADAFPTTLDFWGPNGLLASRRPQFRWTIRDDGDMGHLAVALEQPGAGVDAGKGPQIDPEFAAVPRNRAPDVTAQYEFGGRWGYALVAGVARVRGYERTDVAGAEYSDEKFGWGGYLSTRIVVQDRNLLRVTFLYGHGVSNYLNDGGTDLSGNDAAAVPGDPDADAEALPIMSWHVSYELWWSDTYSSALGFSDVKQENTAFQADDAFRRGRYAFANLLRHPHPGLMYGLEALWGDLEEHDRTTGEDFRIQFSTKFAF